MQQTLKMADCRNFAPVDAAKGLCHERKQMVSADAEPCALFERLPKCKHCLHYVSGEEEYLGVCTAEESRPMTYPDLAGVTCEWFTWRES